jgi:hypothetical protein
MSAAAAAWCSRGSICRRRAARSLDFWGPALLALFKYVFEDQPQTFQRLAPALVGLFPFTIMFLVTSIAGRPLRPEREHVTHSRTHPNVLPLTYAYDALARVTRGETFEGDVARDTVIILIAIVLSLILGAATLRRRPP